MTLQRAFAIEMLLHEEGYMTDRLTDAKLSPERLDELIDWYGKRYGHREACKALRELKALREQCERQLKALTKIAAFNDDFASEMLRMTKSYCGFDEPSAVKTARECLSGSSSE